MNENINKIVQNVDYLECVYPCEPPLQRPFPCPCPPSLSPLGPAPLTKSFMVGLPFNSLPDHLMYPNSLPDLVTILPFKVRDIVS